MKSPVVSHGDTECDAVGIRIGGLPEPLCTAMRVATRRAITAARIAARRLKASALLTDEEVRLRWIEEAEAARSIRTFARCTTSTQRRTCDDLDEPRDHLPPGDLRSA
jgi:hypothetical protein